VLHTGLLVRMVVLVYELILNNLLVRRDLLVEVEG
jgi:hypothetical protein